MSLLQRSAIVSAMLAALAIPAFAQTSPATPTATTTATTTQTAPSAKHHGRSPEAQEAHRAKRMQALKAKLQINASQESAWNDYVTATQRQRPAPGERPNREAFAQMTTPERIDAMQAMHAKRQAAMDQRSQATKTFYAALNPQQQKTFDAETLKRHERHGQNKRHPERQGA